MRQIVVQIISLAVLYNQNVLELRAKAIAGDMRLDGPQAVGRRAFALARIVPVGTLFGFATTRANAFVKKPPDLARRQPPDGTATQKRVVFARHTMAKHPADMLPVAILETPFLDLAIDLAGDLAHREAPLYAFQDPFAKRGKRLIKRVRHTFRAKAGGL